MNGVRATTQSSEFVHTATTDLSGAFSAGVNACESASRQAHAAQADGILGGSWEGGAQAPATGANYCTPPATSVPGTATQGTGGGGGAGGSGAGTRSALSLIDEVLQQ